MEISRTLYRKPEGERVKLLKRVWECKFTWPMGFKKGHFRRGAFPSQYWVVGPLRIYTYLKNEWAAK